MNRRQLLAACGPTLGLLAGCTSNPLQTTEYEECENKYIFVRSLPAPAKEEAETAIEEGVYETSASPVLPEVMDPQRSYLLYSPDVDHGSYCYSIQIEEENTTNRIRATESYPTTEGPSVIYRVPEDSGEGTVDLQIEYAQTYGEASRAEATELLSRTLTPIPGSEIDLDHIAEFQFGDYWATITSEELDLSETIQWTLGGTSGPGREILIEADNVSYRETVEFEPVYCGWDNNGNLDRNFP